MIKDDGNDNHYAQKLMMMLTVNGDNVNDER
jgi:hypothetical protein